MVEAPRRLPHRAIHQDAGLIMICNLDLAHHKPAFRHSVRALEGGRQCMVVAAGEDEGVRIRARRRANGLQWLGYFEGILA